MKGGEFIIAEQKPEDVFITSEFSEEDIAIAQIAEDFVNKEVLPNMNYIENHNWDVILKLFKKAGEIGLLGTDIPEKYGGLNRDIKSSFLIVEKLGAAGSFSVTIGAHTGIGTLPILFYGTEEQKSKYLPGLATGELKSCYALTEPTAGSDANSGKTKATLSADGKYYIINGQKMWITNAGFADIIILFAKIDNDKNLSAFIVEKSFGNIELGEEEKKMGIKGSSTRQVFLNGTRVPVENLLGERDGGFKIAMNILNIGRLKLGAGTLGASKFLLKESVKYAKERIQFGQPIANFGAIKNKIAEQCALILGLESVIYRIAGLIHDRIQSFDKEGKGDKSKVLAFEEYAIEAGIAKVLGSEVLDRVVDHAVQIYGGMGYSAEYPIERAYRDSRINRIFEGTNEINRLLTVEMLMRKSLKGTLPLLSAIQKAQQTIFSSSFSVDVSPSSLISNMKSVCLLCAGAAFQKFGSNIRNEEEVIMNIADIMIQIYLIESLYLANQKMKLKNLPLDVRENAFYFLLHNGIDIIQSKATEIAYHVLDEEERRLFLAGMRRLLKKPDMDIIKIKREIAQWAYNTIS